MILQKLAWRQKNVFLGRHSQDSAPKNRKKFMATVQIQSKIIFPVPKTQLELKKIGLHVAKAEI